MIKHISMPSIEQFRNIIASINRQVTFVGLTQDGDAIYDPSIPKPVLTFKGTVKLHGTNASVCYNLIDGIWAQSKENVITPTKDNAGFAFFVETNKDAFIELANKVVVQNNLDNTQNTVAIFGEWVGKGIQSGVSISSLEKSFFIFGVKISPMNNPNDSEHVVDGVRSTAYWVDSSYLRSPENKIYNIEDYQTYSVDVDFNMPQLAQNLFGEITESVEKECPVALTFGHSGVGEGVVWSTNYKGTVHRFKVKGEKHSSSKVKTLASVDIEKLNSIKEFVDYAVTESRFNQGIEKTFASKEEIDVKKLGDLLRWIVNDITKEESDTMAANGLEPKDVNKYVSQKVREMFFALT